MTLLKQLLDPLFLFRPMAQLLTPSVQIGQGTFVDPEISAQEFAIVATFKIRNDGLERGRWVPRLRVDGLTFEDERVRTGERVVLPAGQTSELQTIRVFGLPAQRYNADLILVDRDTDELVSSISRQVEVVGDAPLTTPEQFASSTFFGTVNWADGPAVREGFVLSAWINGQRAGSVNIRSAGTFGTGTNPLVVRDPTAAPGAVVSFTVNGFTALETASYQPDGLPRRISLTVPR